ncbi:hypothetical protein [Undibacterium luofuense]|uniref:Uncharacterized protein n=1 Tax=Undibacterium luofuense TaxID=2828733 RepID=A0A941I6I1_9BURK|nr:hypothetical protein [Undibacterium luofuense]MBR7781615.1 hypothetical protein [Undibacterium luofuense]
MKRINKTFSGGEPTWANACVGENGSPGYWEYAKGFSQAATILIDLVISDPGMRYSVDEMVYPVCFNMRHSIELRIKGAIEEIIHLSSLKEIRLDFDLVGSHDIAKIWNFFKEKSKNLDDRFENIVSNLDEKIMDIAEIDATGQTFRYPLDTNSKKHLVDVKIINFVTLKERFIKLESSLDELNKLNEFLRTEYQWKSFTKKLSRKNLFEIANILPPRNSWGSEIFSNAKSEIKSQFKIGSAEFSTALRIIEKHYEIAPKINISIPLLGVNEKDIGNFFCQWLKQHKPHSGEDVENQEGIDEILRKMKKTFEIQDDIWLSVLPELTPENLAGLNALFYFSRDLDFSECYIKIYNNNLNEAKIFFHNKDEDSIRRKYIHLLNKTNAIQGILKSIYFLKNSITADNLIKEHLSNEKFSWIEETRSDTKFQKPSYCGYPKD